MFLSYMADSIFSNTWPYYGPSQQFGVFLGICIGLFGFLFLGLWARTFTKQLSFIQKRAFFNVKIVFIVFFIVFVIISVIFWSHPVTYPYTGGQY